ncbi:MULTISPECIES: hypothetical protein [unclassified Nocardia]|uniref:hypothetical protein n=1 Tax=unclassified Nocardia TaxID=2637762 RepID=UPI001CE3BCBE|nr:MULTISPECIES: hypothetical protein [unclassified Nocardia]
MRRIGETVDAVAAFLGAAVAGIALFLPISFSWTGETTPYRIASLINSVPRGAAIGLIVAVAVCVVVVTFTRTSAAWLVATVGMIGMFVNHTAGRHVSNADMLTTQNYLDSVCAGIVLGALGAAVLRRRIPAAAFAIGSAGFFVFGDLADILEISDQDPYSVLETPPRWLIAIAMALLILGTLRNRSRVKHPDAVRMALDLPLAPIVAAMVLSLVVLATSEWLARQFQNSPDAGHGVDIGLAVAATLAAATVAAMLLPGRDGTGVYLAVALVAAADAIGGAPRPGWSIFALLALTSLGMFIGTRLASTAMAALLIAGLAVYAMLLPDIHDNTVLHMTGSSALALTAGYCCGVAWPQYAPSGVLGLTALYLPSIVTALPLERAAWPVPDATAHGTRLGRTALAVAIGCAVGLAVLHRIRPRHRPTPATPVADESFADT